jgi:hypothetical protein
MVQLSRSIEIRGKSESDAGMAPVLAGAAPGDTGVTFTWNQRVPGSKPISQHGALPCRLAGFGGK